MDNQTNSNMTTANEFSQACLPVVIYAGHPRTAMQFNARVVLHRSQPHPYMVTKRKIEAIQKTKTPFPVHFRTLMYTAAVRPLITKGADVFVKYGEKFSVLMLKKWGCGLPSEEGSVVLVMNMRGKLHRLAVGDVKAVLRNERPELETLVRSDALYTGVARVNVQKPGTRKATFTGMLGMYPTIQSDGKTVKCQFWLERRVVDEFDSAAPGVVTSVVSSPLPPREERRPPVADSGNSRDCVDGLARLCEAAFENEEEENSFA